MLVTALENGSDTVLALEMVTECLLREEKKIERRRKSKRWQQASCGQREETGHVITTRDLDLFKKDCFEFAQA